MSVTEMFSNIQGFLSADQDVREDIRKVVQVLEQTAREILTVLQSVHQPSGFKDIPSKCLRARELFCTVRNQIGDLKTKFPADQYYRFHEHWRFVLQRVTFLAAFVVYLESETLVTREEVAQILGIQAGGEQRDGGRLRPALAYLHLHQRAGLGLPPAQPQERPAPQALRRTQV
ncbi:translin isoform X2 [Megalops cyprinoides]|uniref:translin isoform X2 n=1 Tax=Megalops cyprinoides TaxID=118141 RepID=UPI001863D450|nr:translin isoform X2 [Megalops cyprinoides]